MIILFYSMRNNYGCEWRREISQREPGFRTDLYHIDLSSIPEFSESKNPSFIERRIIFETLANLLGNPDRRVSARSVTGRFRTILVREKGFFDSETQPRNRGGRDG